MKRKQKTLKQYDRGAIMRAAHKIKRETGIAFGAAMSQAWAEAKSETGARYVPAPIAPQALPLEALVMGAAGIVRKIARSKVEVGIRVNVTGGIKLTDSAGNVESFGKDYTGAMLFARDNRQAANRLEYRR